MIMDNLRAEIENLDSDLKIQYVFARSKTTSNNKAVDDAGFSQSTFYGWTQEERDHLNSLATRLKTEVGLRVALVLQDFAEDAANDLGKLMKSRNENIRLKSDIEILDRTAGKPTQKIDQRTEHSGKVEIVVDWDDDGIEPDNQD